LRAGKALTRSGGMVESFLVVISATMSAFGTVLMFYT
jgi:hypothetical protein